MAEYRSFDENEPAPKTGPWKVANKTSNGTQYINWRDTEELRRYMTPNGKIQSRKKSGLTAREQRMVAQAIKKARFMGLLPFTSATL